jgi:hypothetical protein
VPFVEALATDKSKEALQWLFHAVVQRPIMLRRLGSQLEERSGMKLRRIKSARLLVADKGYQLILANDARGLGEYLCPSAVGACDAQGLGVAAIEVAREAASRTEQQSFAQLDGLVAIERTQQRVEGDLRGLSSLQEVSNGLLREILLLQPGVPSLCADPKAREYSPGELLDRSDELDDLDTWLRATDSRYLVLTGGSFVGKTALMSEIALRPPDSVDAVSFFIREVSRRNSAASFLDIVNSQLCRLLDRPREAGQDLARRRALFEELWQFASDRAQRIGRPLALLVDGLDEQRIDDDLPISALLPRSDEWSRVLVSKRPNPRRVPGVEADHPYNDASRRPYRLTPLVSLARIAEHAGHVIDELVRDEKPDGRLVLAFLALADGRLCKRDLEELLGDHTVVAPVVERLERHLLGSGSEDDPWEFSHVEFLRKTATLVWGGQRIRPSICSPGIGGRLSVAGWPSASRGSSATTTCIACVIASGVARSLSMRPRPPSPSWRRRLLRLARCVPSPFGERI